MAETSRSPEPLALDELGWRQFFDLCMAVLELDAGVSPGSWVGEEGCYRQTTLSSGLKLPGVRRLAGPCRVEALWISDCRMTSKAGALEYQLL